MLHLWTRARSMNDTQFKLPLYFISTSNESKRNEYESNKLIAKLTAISKSTRLNEIQLVNGQSLRQTQFIIKPMMVQWVSFYSFRFECQSYQLNQIELNRNKMLNERERERSMEAAWRRCILAFESLGTEEQLLKFMLAAAHRSQRSL